MNTQLHNTLFYAQHKNKCYCQNGNLCYCTGIEKSSRSSKETSHKFIKVNSGKVKQNKSRPLSSSSSFSPTPTHMNSLSISSLSSSTGLSSSNTKLTERREMYERSKLEKGDLNSRFKVGMWNVQEHIIFSRPNHLDVLFNDERIEKLQEFRLRNADQCLSAGKRFSIDKTKLLDSSPENKVQDTKYTLNKRGLLKPVGSNDDCRAAIVSSKSAIKDILRQKLNSTKNKDNFIRKTLCLPEKSLALRYQEST